MQFEYSPKVLDLHARVKDFLETRVYPAHARREAEIAANTRNGNAYQAIPVLEELKAEARAAGLWNMFLPESAHGFGLTHL